MAVSAAIRDDGAGSADQVVRVVWSWSGFLTGSQEQTRPPGTEWRSPTIGNYAYEGKPVEGGTFTISAQAFDAQGQSAVVTSGPVSMTGCSAPWILRVAGTPDPVGMAPPPAHFCSPPQPNLINLFVGAEIDTHGGVDFPSEVRVEWRLDVDGTSGSGTMEAIHGGWGYTLPALGWTRAREPGGKIQLTVRLYDEFGLVHSRFYTATLAPCKPQPIIIK